MFSHLTDKVDCIVRTEIRDWFKKLITETCGPDVHISYKSNGGHFNVHTYVEISGSKSKINQVAEIIRNTYETVKYKMPWLNENMYYARTKDLQRKAEYVLNMLQDVYPDYHYKRDENNVIGFSVNRFYFRPNLLDQINILIDKIFKNFSSGPPIFIMYPKTIASHTQSYSNMTTNILTVFHGKFLSYLNTEDIFSLELANKRNHGSCYDTDLDHDIQNFLQKEYPNLHGGVTIDYNYILKEFKINNVLCYFIHKYNDRFTKISIPNILTTEEMQLLSSAYNIEIEQHSIIHIDFKSANDLETVDFCAIYHFDSNRSYFLNYDPKCATENYSIDFRADGSLDTLQCNKEFSHFVLKSQINCSPQKSNSVLNYLTKHFKTKQNNSTLILNEFDMNHVSNQILNSLLALMNKGKLQFLEMSFKLKTFMAILEQSDKNFLVFKKCHIAYENVMAMLNTLVIKCLQFVDMEVDLNVMNILKNIETLEIDNCRIVRPSREVIINMVNVNNVHISLTCLDITTVRTLMKGLQCAKTFYFVSCYLTPSDHFEETDFTVRNQIVFENMIFEIQLLFQMIEKCEFLNPLLFKGCHFHFKKEVCFKFSLRPVNLEFYYITFNSSVLLTTLAMLNKESKICIRKSRFLPLSAYILIKTIHLNYLEFSNCKLETNILLSILGKMSRNTAVWIYKCDLLYSSEISSNILTNLSKINFRGTKMSSQDVFAILDILKENSLAYFDKCEINGDSERFSKINLQKQIIINFSGMTIPPLVARLLLQMDSMIVFNNCNLEFMTNEFSDLSIRSNVTFRNMKFDAYEHLKCLAKLFTPKSRITFDTCHFDFNNFRIPIIVIKPLELSFYRTSFELDVLVTIMEMISEQTKVTIDECDVQSITQVFSRRPIKFKNPRYLVES